MVFGNQAAAKMKLQIRRLSGGPRPGADEEPRFRTRIGAGKLYGGAIRNRTISLTYCVPKGYIQPCSNIPRKSTPEEATMQMSAPAGVVSVGQI